jgi:putative ABC transport system substrate-binding protein
MYPWRDYVEAGGLMAYGTDFAELWRRLADDVHEILNGANRATSRSINPPNSNSLSI